MAALVVATEWLPRHGDLQVTLVQRENACILRKHDLDVYYMVLQATQEDEADAAKHGITLVTPKEIDLVAHKNPSIDWLLLHQSMYPHIKAYKDIGVIIGHVTADQNHNTANAAFSIQREIFNVAKLVPVFHTIPLDVISNPQKAHELERNMVELAEGANLVVSVGPKVWNTFSNKVVNRDLHMCYLPFVEESISGLQFGDRKITSNIELLSHVRESLAKCCDEYKAVAGAVGRISTSFYDTMDLTSKWKFVCGHPVNQFEEFRSSFLKLTDSAPKLEINKVHTVSVIELSQIIQQSHILIHGPKTDPVGITPLMACTAGIPSVITSNCGFAEFLKEHFPLLAKHVIVDVGLHQSEDDKDEWRKAVANVIKKYSDHIKAAKELKECLIESAKTGIIAESHTKFADWCSAACGVFLQEGEEKSPEDKEGTASPLRANKSDEAITSNEATKSDEAMKASNPKSHEEGTASLLRANKSDEATQTDEALKSDEATKASNPKFHEEETDPRKRYTVSSKKSARKRKLESDEEGISPAPSPSKTSESSDFESSPKSQKHDEHKPQEDPSLARHLNRQQNEIAILTEPHQIVSCANQSSRGGQLDTKDFILRQIFSTVKSKDDLPLAMEYAKQINAVLKDIQHGSLLVVFGCTTLETVETLERDERDGKLGKIFEKDIVTEDVLKRCNATSISLKTTVETWQYQKCALEIKYYQKDSVRGSTSRAEGELTVEKEEYATRFFEPMAVSDKKGVKGDGIENSQMPAVCEDSVSDRHVGDTGESLPQILNEKEQIPATQNEDTALIAMEVEPNAYRDDAYRRVLSTLVGDYTEIPPDESSVKSENQAAYPVVLLKLARKNVNITRLEILHLFGIRRIFRNIYLESCMQTDSNGRECFSPSELVCLLGTDIADVFIKKIGTIGKGSLEAKALAPLKTVTVDMNNICLGNYLLQEYGKGQRAKIETKNSENQLNQMNHQIAHVEKEKQALEDNLRQLTSVLEKRENTISKLTKTVNKKNNEISHIVKALKQTTMNLRTQLSLKEMVSHAKMMQDVLVDLDELIQGYSGGKGEGVLESDSEDLEYTKALAAADTVKDANVDMSETSHKQTALGVTKDVKSGQSKSDTATEVIRETTKVTERTKDETEVQGTVEDIVGGTDGKIAKAMEGLMAVELATRDPKFTERKDTTDTFSRDTATDEAIGVKYGRKGIPEASGSSIDTGESKVKKKKTFTRRMSSAMQKLVSKFTISEKKEELIAVDEQLDSRFTIPEKKDDFSAVDEKLDSRFTIPEKKKDFSAVDEKFPELLSAALESDMSKIANLIEKGADVNAVNKDGYTSLHIAAAAGDVDIVKYVIKAGIDKDKKNKDMMTAIMLAAKNNHQDVVKVLVDSGAKLNSQAKDGYTPLHYAAQNGHKDVAEILIGAKANIEAVTKHNQMPVHLAAWKGHLDIVKYFIESLGMDKEIKGLINKTPLINAAEGGCSDVVKYLLSIGADIEAVTSDGFTPLLWATYKGNKDVADILIGAKANIEALTKDGFTPLHLAAQEGHKDVAEILIGAKANIEALTKDSSMPVHLAALKGHLDIVKYFIETLGIDKEVKGQDNKTPLICAAEGGQNEVVKYLLGIGADIEAVTSGGFTPLHYAAQECHKDVAEILIGAKANIEAVSQDNSMPVHLAALKGHLDIVKYFIGTLGIDKEVKGQANRTPLIYAAEGGHSEVVKYLLGIGSDIEAVTPDGKTALRWALDNGHTEVAKLLTDASTTVK